MKTILIDDESIMLNRLKKHVEEQPVADVVGAFEFPTDALVFAQHNEVEFAILDIEMPEMNGLELGRKLKAINPNMVLAFVTGYDEYVKEAIIDIKADFYILKPYSKDQVADIVDKAWLLTRKKKNRVYMKTFGRFDIFIDSELVKIKNSKSKELIALCVNQRGGIVTMEVAVTYLWPDRAYDEKTKNLYRKAVAACNKLFKEYDCEDVFSSERSVCYVNRDKFDCDYYKYISGDRSTKYFGEYMIDYDWATETQYSIDKIRGKNEN